jgi:hypothetical protein
VVLRIPVAPARRSRYGALTPSGGAFQHLRVDAPTVLLVLQPQAVFRPPGLGSSRVARHYCGNLILISSRRATEMFQFTRCPPSLPMCSAGGLQTSLWRGCPIRNLRAHRLHAAPPERFAGLRVLLRLSAPRHPPRTLCSLFSLSLSLSRLSSASLLLSAKLKESFSVVQVPGLTRPPATHQVAGARPPTTEEWKTASRSTCPGASPPGARSPLDLGGRLL